MKLPVLKKYISSSITDTNNIKNERVVPKKQILKKSSKRKLQEADDGTHPSTKEISSKAATKLISAKQGNQGNNKDEFLNVHHGQRDLKKKRDSIYQYYL
jgi:hypothetical protein